jgi:hypothetical protein
VVFGEQHVDQLRITDVVPQEDLELRVGAQLARATEDAFDIERLCPVEVPGCHLLGGGARRGDDTGHGGKNLGFVSPIPQVRGDCGGHATTDFGAAAVGGLLERRPSRSASGETGHDRDHGRDRDHEEQPAAPELSRIRRH